MEIAIIQAIGGIFTGISDLVVSGRDANYGRLPDWLSPTDYEKEAKEQTRNLQIGISVIVVVLVIAILILAVKKGK